MGKGFTVRAAGLTALTVLTLLLVFHVLMIAGLFPDDMVWGGRASGTGGNLEQMEGISVVITLLFIAITAMGSGYMKMIVPPMVVKAGLWIMVAYFLFNSLANFASPSSLERWIFLPVSLLLCALLLRIVLGKRS